MPQVLFLVFMLTGATSLIFQVVWTRLLLLSVGTTPTAMSVVLAAFMGGMAIGAILAGRWLTRYDSVRTYAWLEGWAGLYGLATPALLVLVDAAPIGVQIVVATALLLPATIAMGASLPVLSRALGEGADRPAVTVGFLYAANTLGAVAGPLLGVFALFPVLGLHRTLVTAAIVNLAVCALLLILRAGRPSDALARTPPVEDRALARTPPVEEGAHAGATVLVALAGSGAAAMVYEVAWSRTLSMAFGSSIYGVSIMLSMFLLGLAGGSWIASLVLARLRRAPSSLALAWLLVGSSTTAFISLHLGRVLPFTFLELFRDLPNSPAGVHAIQVILSLALMLPTTLCLGAMLPTAVAIVGGRSQVGRSVGRLYSANLLGSSAGAVGASLLLVASVGIEASVRMAALGALFVALVLVARQPRFRVATAAGAALSVMVILTLDGTPARLAQTFGMYAVAPQYVPYDANGMRQVLSVHELLYYEDGPTATVAVQRVDKYHLLKINGKTDASNGATDVQTQTLVGHLPLMVTDAERVAVVGWGSGMTVGAALTHPVDTVDAYEIEPAVVEASRFFEPGNGSPLPHNGDPLSDPRLTMILGDARGELRRQTVPYDVIINQPSNPWLTGVANLFTRDFFELLASKLAPTGVVCQWVQTYGMSEQATRTLMATFRSVFPHVVTFTDRDLIMLGSFEPIRFSAPRLRERFRNPRIRASLRFAFVEYPADLIVKLGLDDHGMDAFAAGAPLNTDDNMRIELAAPRTLYADHQDAIYAALAEHPAMPLDLVTNYDSEAEVSLELAASFFTDGRDDDALAHAEHALALDPSFDGLKLLGQIAHRQGDTGRARNAWSLALAMGGDDAGRAFVRGLLQSLDVAVLSN